MLQYVTCRVSFQAFVEVLEYFDLGSLHVDPDDLDVPVVLEDECGQLTCRARVDLIRIAGEGVILPSCLLFHHENERLLDDQVCLGAQDEDISLERIVAVIEHGGAAPGNEDLSTANRGHQVVVAGRHAGLSCLL